MAGPANLVRTVVAVSSAVVAVCAVVVTIKVVSMGPVQIDQPRVLDQRALEQQVSDAIQGLSSTAPHGVACPGSVVVVAGKQFTCTYWNGLTPGQATVEITNADGELSINSGQ